MLRIVAISDLHGDGIPVADLPEGDVLVIAGDVLADDYFDSPQGRASSHVGRQGQFFDEVWIPYLRQLSTKYRKVLWITGNHDFFLESMMSGWVQERMPENVYYLAESSLVVDGINFYGAPWNMAEGWAFAITERDYARRLGAMPEDTDILITHGPPHVDGMPGFHYASRILGDWLALTPTIKHVICGHIHEAYGTYAIGDTAIHVVSSKNRNYELVNPPVVIDIPDKEPVDEVQETSTISS